jgi:hypothetical protein
MVASVTKEPSSPGIMVLSSGAKLHQKSLEFQKTTKIKKLEALADLRRQSALALQSRPKPQSHIAYNEYTQKLLLQRREAAIQQKRAAINSPRINENDSFCHILEARLNSKSAAFNPAACRQQKDPSGHTFSSKLSAIDYVACTSAEHSLLIHQQKEYPKPMAPAASRIVMSTIPEVIPKTCSVNNGKSASTLDRRPSKKTKQRLQERLERGRRPRHDLSRRLSKEARYHKLSNTTEELSAYRDSKESRQKEKDNESKLSYESPLSPAHTKETIHRAQSTPPLQTCKSSQTIFDSVIGSCITPRLRSITESVFARVLLDPLPKSNCNVEDDDVTLPDQLNDLVVRSTHDELYKLKQGLKKLKQRHTSKRVRFSDCLVTSVHHRPYTEECDIEKLYFVEEELDTLEWDRATTEPHQFEVHFDGVEYKNKKERSKEFDLLYDDHLIDLTPSDLSALCASATSV